uniref:Uncharacterized protein n=1 Tax=Parascaris equorum TaxID=6256 RepID=A0A914S0F1_PAREQ
MNGATVHFLALQLRRSCLYSSFSRRSFFPSLRPDGWKNVQMIFGGPFSFSWFNPFVAPYVSKPSFEYSNLLSGNGIHSFGLRAAHHICT